jgi:hypothetical protein
VGVTAAVAVAVAVAVGVTVAVAVAVAVGVGVGVAVTPDAQYLPPVLNGAPPSYPPHTTIFISLSVQTAL